MRYLAFLLILATPLHAESYRLIFGNNVIGSLTQSPGGFRSEITASPLGVGNGVFEASAAQVRMDDGRAVTQYLSHSPAKGRRISVLHKDGVVLETVVSPASDATALSEATAVPAGVSDPVAVLGDLLRDRNGCPGRLTFYEGRRVVTISPAGSETANGTLTCEMNYRVTAGPGHFSPLFIKSARMALTYRGGALEGLQISSGPFTLTVAP